VFTYSEEANTLPGSSTQLIVEKILPLASMTPGDYNLTITAEDRNRNKTVSNTATFHVK
jgi:uncharacterized membrane protein